MGTIEQPIRRADLPKIPRVNDALPREASIHVNTTKWNTARYLLFSSFIDNDYYVLFSVEFWRKACGQFLAAVYTFGFSFRPMAVNICSQRKLNRFLVFYKLNCLSLSFRDDYEDLKLIYQLTRKKTLSVESMNQLSIFFIFFLFSCIFRRT